jgi:hypothetical protein
VAGVGGQNYENESRLYRILRSVDSLEDWRKEKNKALSTNFCQKILIRWQLWDAVDTGSSSRDGCNEPTLPTKHCHVRTVIDEGGRD